MKLETLAARVKYMMDFNALSQQSLADQVGVSQQAIGQILKGDISNPKKILEIATALGVNPHWLKTGKGPMEPTAQMSSVSMQKDDDHILRVDLLDAELAAHSSGIINAEYPDVISTIFFTHEGVKRILGRTTTDGVYMFKVPTDSMAPTITQNDIVFIDTNVKEYIGEGVYSFNLNGETYIKRLQRLPTGVIMALSDNPLYHPFEITEALFDTAEIIGKFIKAVELKPKDL
ncbi:XRE family transcriptional regulator [Aggregatibacter actinomycetemcomitans]|uniref:XRE family transcriptional regulator n=1 Tax=Aggregatibacter actinomycetemcomitans TaxID=714 RepID=UPI00197C55DC|nr:helix-turn-helix transcriptional regulator [Aggregatibacter actinomycetemcomitans]MBN6064213.1 helix-turn-helix transcriptional regulator [Aggregatibacter actinomycetemcomitans]MBN6081289.1 helix-turn-helix transcriptional regulator [Aggregatibacter actinomycetemcomitans]MBN6084056.1 helix-turn-helix transcriptional regulator [Aggregatibacter actinomycetemcomitans]